jgi:hypothetical protein
LLLFDLLQRLAKASQLIVFARPSLRKSSFPALTQLLFPRMELIAPSTNQPSLKETYDKII